MSHIAVDAVDVEPVGSPAAADMHPTSASAPTSAARLRISSIALALPAFDTDFKQTTGDAFRPGGVTLRQVVEHVRALLVRRDARRSCANQLPPARYFFGAFSNRSRHESLQK
jgi:hypothetical protein